MQLGEGRLSRASERLVSYGDGYLSVSTIRNAVVHVGSTRTELVAHPMGYEWYHIPLTTSNGTRTALIPTGSFVTDQDQRQTLRTDFDTAFVSADSITVLLTSSASNVITSVASRNASGFSSLISQFGGTGSNVTITWCAIGMVET
jgi:hypothetical protein